MTFEVPNGNWSLGVSVTSVLCFTANLFPDKMVNGRKTRTTLPRALFKWSGICLWSTVSTRNWRSKFKVMFIGETISCLMAVFLPVMATTCSNEFLNFQKCKFYKRSTLTKNGNIKTENFSAFSMLEAEVSSTETKG